jgi:hypothetical protein
MILGVAILTEIAFPLAIYFPLSVGWFVSCIVAGATDNLVAPAI